MLANFRFNQKWPGRKGKRKTRMVLIVTLNSSSSNTIAGKTTPVCTAAMGPSANKHHLGDLWIFFPYFSRKGTET